MKRCGVLLILMMLLLVVSQSAMAGPPPALGAQKLSNVIANTTGAMWQFPNFLAAISYLFGIVVGAWAIQKFYLHVQDPRQYSVWDGISRTIAAGCFFSLPMMTQVVFNTLNGGAAVNSTMTGFNGTTSGGGLDAMVVALVDDIWIPMQSLMAFFSAIAGVVFILIGISRLMKSAQEGPRGPGGFGTLMIFLVAGALLSLDSMVGHFGGSLFQTANTRTFAVLNYTGGMSGAEVNHVHAVVSGIVAFMAILGWISFIRGWFIVREVSDGVQSASLMAAITHLIGGALAINLGPMINAVERTLGITAYGITFN